MSAVTDRQPWSVRYFAKLMFVAILILIWSIIVLLYATGLLLPSESDRKNFHSINQ